MKTIAVSGDSLTSDENVILTEVYPDTVGDVEEDPKLRIFCQTAGAAPAYLRYHYIDQTTVLRFHLVCLSGRRTKWIPEWVAEF